MNYIYGKIIYVGKQYLIIDNNGIGWKIKITEGSNFPVGEFMKVYIYQQQKLDQRNNLITETYGFCCSWDRQLFMDLLSIHGIGTMIASSAISYGHEFLITQIINEDLVKLTSIKGVNSRIANLIVLELKPKYERIKDQFSNNIETKPTKANDELTLALKQLGYSNEDIDLGLSVNQDDLELSDMIKNAMHIIAKSHESQKL
ncbi:MAG: Holliday junction branch migration protein RuvA [Mycoplasma sp.]